MVIIIPILVSWPGGNRGTDFQEQPSRRERLRGKFNVIFYATSIRLFLSTYTESPSSSTTLTTTTPKERSPTKYVTKSSRKPPFSSSPIQRSTRSLYTRDRTLQGFFRGLRIASKGEGAAKPRIHSFIHTPGQHFILLLMMPLQNASHSTRTYILFIYLYFYINYDNLTHHCMGLALIPEIAMSTFK